MQASVVLTEEDAAFAAAKHARHNAHAQSGRSYMVRKNKKLSAGETIDYHSTEGAALLVFASE